MTTPNLGLPYPDPSDPVAEGADAIRELAERLDIRLPGFDIQIGEVVGVTGATGGFGPLAFPRPFGVKPAMSLLSGDLTAFDGSFAQYAGGCDAAQFTFNAYRANGTPTVNGEPVRFLWIAVGASALARGGAAPRAVEDLGEPIQLHPYPVITGPNGEALTADEADELTGRLVAP